MVFLPDN